MVATVACQDVECPQRACLVLVEEMFGPRDFPGPGLCHLYPGEIPPSNPSMVSNPFSQHGTKQYNAQWNWQARGAQSPASTAQWSPVHVAAESACPTDPDGSADWTPQPTDPPPAACTADPALPQSAASADKAAAELPAAAHYCSTRPEARRPKQQIGSLQNQITAQQAQYLKNQQPQQQSSPNLLLENNGPWSNAHGSDAGSGEKPTNTSTSEEDNFPEFVLAKAREEL